MPNYTYDCTVCSHVFDMQAGYDDSTVACTTCGQPAKRRAAYPEQSVIFRGQGFTKSVLPPAPPEIPSTAGESTDTDFAIKDEYAKVSYDHDRNVRPYVKEAKKKGLA